MPLQLCVHRHQNLMCCVVVKSPTAYTNEQYDLPNWLLTLRNLTIYRAAFHYIAVSESSTKISEIKNFLYCTHTLNASHLVVYSLILKFMKESSLYISFTAPKMHLLITERATMWSVCLFWVGDTHTLN